MNIPEQFLQKIANYLALMPYREVAGLLAELNQIVSENKSESTSNPPEQLPEDKK